MPVIVARCRFNISRRLFEQLVSEGQITAVRITPRARRFVKADLMNFIRARMRSGAKR